jgi:hypothetical protein
MTINSVQHAIGADGLFVLQLGSGDVRVRGVDGEVVHVEDRHGNPIVDDFDIETGEGSLAVRARKGLRISVGSGRHATPDLDVRVPHGATIVVEAASSDIAAEDLDGDQRFQTSSGDIELLRVSGTVSIEAASGDVELLSTGRLRLKARTVSGDLAVRAGELAEIVAATTSGDLTIAGELAADGAHKIETVSGDAKLALAGGARVEVSTVTGDVSADVPHRFERTDGRRVLVVGDGQARIAVATMSGDVRVGKPRSREMVITPNSRRPGRAALTTPREPAPAAPPEPPSPSAAAIAAAYEDARLTILKQLERGEIDVTEAGRRLEALDAADIPEESTRG